MYARTVNTQTFKAVKACLIQLNSEVHTRLKCEGYWSCKGYHGYTAMRDIMSIKGSINGTMGSVILKE